MPGLMLIMVASLALAPAPAAPEPAPAEASAAEGPCPSGADNQGDCPRPVGRAYGRRPAPQGLGPSSSGAMLVQPHRHARHHRRHRRRVR